MIETWNIGLDPWILSDGNYDDFRKGQDAEFAIEFYPKILKAAGAGPKTAKCSHGDEYVVDGEVVAVLEDAWVIDVGLLMFQSQTPPEGVVPGTWISGTVNIGVDPFFYFEELYKIQSIPPMVYSWNIRRIIRELCPLIEGIDPRIGQCWVPGESRMIREEVDGTDAPTPPGVGHIIDDGPPRPTHSSYYVFECEKLNVAPKRNSATAT